MLATMVWEPHFSFSSAQQMEMSRTVVERLLMACAMGGIVGLEREYHHKDSGLRTNLLICVGSALFTMMGIILAGDGTPDKSRVASNIVQGIGFLGAGLILHTRSRVVGLTSAATVWVVASIGMACGAGLYFVAAFATILLVVALQFVGVAETKLGWKRFPRLYEVRAEVGSALSKEIVGAERAEKLAEEAEAARRRMFLSVLKVLDAQDMRLHVLDRENIAGMERMDFVVVATRGQHAEILKELQENDETDQVVTREVEDE
jgi:putative Mg2+ transporter-C (MgtC) family protein